MFKPKFDTIELGESEYAVLGSVWFNYNNPSYFQPNKKVQVLFKRGIKIVYNKLHAPLIPLVCFLVRVIKRI